MADQQRIAPPFGDIFLVPTPTLDRMANQLYVEQKQRELQYQKENQALDESFRKEFAKVRSVDTPEVINSYNQYKQLKKQLLFDPKVKKDPLVYNQVQQQANAALQDAYSKINKSGELATMGKTLTTERMKNPNLFDDNFGSLMSTFMNTPISGLGQVNLNGQPIDLTNPDTYRYKGPNTDFSKIYKDAAGMPRDILGKESPMDKLGLQFQTPTYKFGNTPAQFKDYVLGATATAQTGRDATKMWDATPQSEKDAIIKEFQSIPLEKWQKMGLEGPQDILPKNPDNKAEAWASLQAMKYAIAAQPQEGKPIVRTSEARKMQLQEEKERRMAALRKADAKELIEFKKQIDPNDTEMNNLWVERFWDTRIEDAKSGRPVPFRDPNNPLGVQMAYQIKGDPNMMRSLARNGIEPDRVYVTADNKIMPVFFQYETEKDAKGNTIEDGKQVVKTNLQGEPLYDTDYSTPMDLDQAYLAMGFKGQTKKDLGKTMGSTYRGKSEQKAKNPLPAGKPRTVKQNGFTYTWNEMTGKYE